MTLSVDVLANMSLDHDIVETRGATTSKATNFTYPDEWTEMSWGFDPTLRQVSFTWNVLETSGMGSNTIIFARISPSRSHHTWSYLVSFLRVINCFGLLISPLDPPKLSHASVVGCELFFHDISKPPLSLEISLGIPSAFTHDIFIVDEFPDIYPTRVLSLNLDVGEAEDNNTYNPSKHILRVVMTRMSPITLWLALVVDYVELGGWILCLSLGFDQLS